VLPRMASDLLPVLAEAAHGNLATTEIEWSDQAAVNVVLATRGYPDEPHTGDEIRGLGEASDSLVVFHAGTRRHDRRLVTDGGRVLSVVGLGDDLGAARAAAYRGVEGLEFAGMQYRTDIGAAPEPDQRGM